MPTLAEAFAPIITNSSAFPLAAVVIELFLQNSWSQFSMSAVFLVLKKWFSWTRKKDFWSQKYNFRNNVDKKIFYCFRKKDIFDQEFISNGPGA